MLHRIAASAKWALRNVWINLFLFLVFLHDEAPSKRVKKNLAALNTFIFDLGFFNGMPNPSIKFFNVRGIISVFKSAFLFSSALHYANIKS